MIALDQWLDFLAMERWSLFDATAAHLELVLEAVILAVCVGLPLGIAAARRPLLERATLALANVLQTIPSLALLGFLSIAFRGQIGKAPALMALLLYALLPIIKNTILGLRSISPEVREASLALGMTARQRLAWVELPLAMPIVLGGVRVATVASVGMATIAAAIGARGLGSYIFRGVALSDTRLILAGSVPAALLALAADAALGEAERLLDPARPRVGRIRLALSGVAVFFFLSLAAWGFWLDHKGENADRPAIRIGSKDGSEMILLGHLLADLVEARTEIRVDRRFNLGGTLVCYNALRREGLDAYVEYTGTALTTILKESVQNDRGIVLERVRALLRARDGVICLDPLGFENTFALLVRRDLALRLGLRTISDLRKHQRVLRAGFGPEFMNRPDGYPGLIRAYGLKLGQPPREMDRNLLYQALVQGSIDLAAGDSTDGRIAAFDLVQLEDDRRYFPPYEAVPLVRSGLLEKYPELREAMNVLAGKIDSAAMRRLNQEVDDRKRRPEEVAHEFLIELGLLGR
ncbi:MAG: ABC transporter permease/substrate-binding protein [Planctomycetaceae bacterium]|nr:ABC transporter permease/substrate-binding protein [Planctomycetaceae bacterium]